MKTSESIVNISKALAAAQGKIKNPECNETVVVTMKAGGSYSYKYATLPKCFDATRAPFSENGLSHTADITFDGTRCRLCVRLSHESGEWYESEMFLNANQPDKDLAGSITFFKRYLFNGLAGIAGDEDLQEENGDRGPIKEGKGSPRSGKDRETRGNQFDKEEAGKKPASGPRLPQEDKKPKVDGEGQVFADPRLEALKRVLGASVASGWENEQVSVLVRARYKKDTAKDLTIEQLEDLEKTLRTTPPPVAGPAVIPPPKDKNPRGPSFDELP